MALTHAHLKQTAVWCRVCTCRESLTGSSDTHKVFEHKQWDGRALTTMFVTLAKEDLMPGVTYVPSEHLSANANWSTHFTTLANAPWTTGVSASSTVCCSLYSTL